MDMIIADESPSSVSDKIKDILFAKSAEKIDAAKPDVAAQTFNQETDSEAEVQDAVADNAASGLGKKVTIDLNSTPFINITWKIE